MYRVRTVFIGVPGTPWYSNLFFDDQDAGGLEGAHEAVVDFWANLSGVISSEVSWTVEGEVAAISPGTGEIENVFNVAPASRSGSATGQPLPWMSQGLVRWETGAYMGGRRLRGRTFIPGATEDDSVNGLPTNDYVTDLLTAANYLLNTSPATPVVYSRKNLIQSPVVSAGAASYWALLRSRRD